MPQPVEHGFAVSVECTYINAESCFPPTPTYSDSVDADGRSWRRKLPIEKTAGFSTRMHCDLQLHPLDITACYSLSYLCATRPRCCLHAIRPNACTRKIAAAMTCFGGARLLRMHTPDSLNGL